jgi:hypothetical protein
MTVLPPLDNMLLWEAETKATGGNIHLVNTAIAKYKNAHVIAKRRQAKGTLDAQYVAKVEDARRNLRKTLRGS